jgi:hypothetical protein
MMKAVSIAEKKNHNPQRMRVYKACQIPHSDRVFKFSKSNKIGSFVKK